VKLHASVIEKEGRALLFLGKSGTGKSTHSRLWQQYVPGCSLLNDDEPVVRVNDKQEVWVYGTPWSGKTPCYRNDEARVAAFVLLHQAPENRLTKLSAKEALFTLFASSSMLRSDVQHKNAVFATLAAILEQVPVYRLDCRPDREAVSLTETLLLT
jgi:energy-coupling factor transporter ATP-binding protein EcfA2